MSDSSLLQRSLEALEQFFAGNITMRQALAEVTALVTVAVPQAEFAGITMTVDGTPGTWIFTHPDVSRVDRVQYDTGDGPCLDAWRTGEVQMIDSTRGDGPWRRFRQASFEHGILSTVSLPLLINQEAIGALNLYARAEDAFGESDVRIAGLFAAQTALVLTNAQAYWDSRSLDETLAQLTAGRAVIEQAKGVLMESLGCPPQSATGELAARARRDHVTVREAAGLIVRAVSTRASDTPLGERAATDEGGAA